MASHNATKLKQSLIWVLSLGTLLEWAEYTFYGYMAVTLSNIFFPSDNIQIGILKTFAVFAVGYVMRPLGAILFGTIGDRYGRKPALMGALLLMGIATLGIGCLPTYAQIGALAPILLLMLRLIQGLAISGEYNGAGIFVTEKAKSHQPAYAGSWISASAAAGMVVGGLAAFVISLPTMPAYAWRIPFLLGGFSCFVGLWLRRSVPEEAKTLKPTTRFPLLEVFKHHRRGFFVTAAIAAFTGVFVYIGNIYIVVFLKTTAGLPTHHATLFAIFGESLVMIFIPIMGWLADRIDALKQYRFGLILVMIGMPFIFLLSSSPNYYLIALAMAIYGLLNGIVCGPMVKILFDQFPYSVRYTGVSFGWSISAAIFSGTAPMMAQFLTQYFDWVLAPSFYVSLIALVAYMILSSKPKNAFASLEAKNSNVYSS